MESHAPSEQPATPDAREPLLAALEALTRELAAQAQPRPEHTAEHRETQLLGQFMGQQPPLFDGLTDPVAAEEWLLSISEILGTLNCPKERWVPLATYLLRDGARYWWRSLLAVRRITANEMSWEQFSEVFLEKYFPVFAREKLQEEFIQLRQGSDSVAAYVDRFHRLERFCPGTYLTERARAQKFVRGLCDGLRAKVLSRVPSTLDKAIECATLLDEDFHLSSGRRQRARSVSAGASEVSAAGPSEGQRSTPSGGQDRGKKRQKPNPSVQQSGTASSRPGQTTSTARQRPPRSRQQQQQRGGSSTQGSQQGAASRTCQRCGKSHPGVCRLDTGACLRCGSMDHFVRDCPHPPGRSAGQEQSGERPRAQGRVYAVTAEQARGADVLTGTEPTV